MYDRVVVQKNTFLAITPAKLDDYMPLACPVCDTLMCLDDAHTWEEFSCCSQCANAWAYLRKEEWKTGWRPSPDVIKDVCSLRPKLRVNIGAL
jgi:hypothetical protein